MRSRALQSQSPATALRAARRAFSLTELVVVSTIIIVLSTSAVVGYRNLRSSDDVEATARRIQATLQRARNLAINSGEEHEFAIDIDERTFWVDNVSASNPAPKVDGLAFGSEFVRISGVRQGAGLLVSSGEVRIPFDPDGSSPFAVIQLIRQGDDDLDVDNYQTVRLFPHGEVRVERTQVN